MQSNTRRKAVRENRAIHMYFCRDMTQYEIAEELDVTQATVSDYINSEPSQEVQEMIEWRSKQVRVMALEELRQQLKTAGEQARNAEHVAKVWPDDGNIVVSDIRDDSGQIVERIPIPDDFDIMPDDQARYFRRQEVREIIDQMAELVGAKEAEQHEVEHSLEDVTGEFVSLSDE